MSAVLAQNFVEDIVTQALAIGQQKADEASEYADRADLAAQGFTGINPQAISFTPANVEPLVNIPLNATGVDSALYNSTYSQIIGDLSTQFAGFFAEYFPNECNTIAHAETWICKALTEGGTGINAAVENQIWQRDRARVLNEVNRASQETMALFASRGFPLPPGAAQHQVYMAQVEAQNKIGQASRDVAIKQVEMELENVKFAIQQALDYRVKGIQAAAEYIKTLALGPEIAMKLATSAASAQAQLISAASSYYNARIKVEEIKLDVLKTNTTEANKSILHFVDAFNERLKARASVLSAAATSAGTQAAAALNAVHASAQVIAQGD